VVLTIEATKRELVVLHHHKEIKHLPLKGLYRQAMNLKEYRQAIMEEARAELRGWRPMVESGSASQQKEVSKPPEVASVS
jgi:hypothetical protein